MGFGVSLTFHYFPPISFASSPSFFILSGNISTHNVHWPWCKPRRSAEWRLSPTAQRWWCPASCWCWPTAWGPPGDSAGRERGGPSCFENNHNKMKTKKKGWMFSLLNQWVQIFIWWSTGSDLHSNRTHTRSTSTVGDAEGLVQVKMRYVRAVISWTAQSHLERKE